jgi:hypothetical protein
MKVIPHSYTWISPAIVALLILLTSRHPAACYPGETACPPSDTVIRKKNQKPESREPAEKILPPSKVDPPTAPGNKFEYELPDEEETYYFRHRNDEDDRDEWADDLEEDIGEMVKNLTRGLSRLRFDFDFDDDGDDFDIDIDEDDLRDLERKSRDIERRTRGMEDRMREKFDDEWEEKWRIREEEIERHSEDIARRIEQTVERSMENWGASFELKMKDFERRMERWEEELKEFERVLRKELISDGYLREGEKIRELSWDDDGEIEVNGREIRREHREKYRELHRKYFRSRGFRYSE